IIFFIRLCKVYLIAVILRIILFLMQAVFEIYSAKEEFRDRPIKGILQTGQTIVLIVGVIIIISTFIGEKPGYLLTGLGASAAVLMLVFQDSILGVVSGIQLSANNMLKVGDWITVPKYDADGTVIEVTLNTVKVQNFDKTITTLPPYALIKDSFQNWRGMVDANGRRVKRFINIDMTSVKFCTEELLQRFSEIDLLRDYILEKEEEIELYNEKNEVNDSILINGRRQTNLGVFRHYLTIYLKTLSRVNQKEGFMCMVRQLQPTESGIPLELYFFSNTSNWIAYENLQADVFDHVLASIPTFDLRVHQSPTGHDLQKLGKLIQN
ncbi:MAG: mechanosensitive ion channel family protein, partial [Bacteroides sp.]